MENTLQIKDRVVVNKLPFLSETIHRGDVVVFRDPDNWLPEPMPESGNKIILKAKEVLVAVGVLPNPAKQFLVKRVIGVAGDHIVCCDTERNLEINGKTTNEPYIFAGNGGSELKFDVIVPEGKIWVMGDHRQTLDTTKPISIAVLFRYQRLPVESLQSSGRSRISAQFHRKTHSQRNKSHGS
jgi:signal peptidase I